DQQRHQPELWTKLVGVDVVAEWKSRLDAHGLVAPADDERDEEKDHELRPTVATNPMHDGKAHEYAHRNERAEALQIAVAQQACGAQEHIESDEDAKPCIPCSRLFAHGRGLSLQAPLSNLQPTLWPF